MAKEIIGSYPSKDEAVNVVERLELKGFVAKNITIFANSDHKKEMEKRTDVKVKSDATENEDDESFMDKVKKVFTGNSVTDSHIELHEKLVNAGVSEHQAQKYSDEIESGNILVVADDELKMGNDATSDTVTLEETAIRRD
ncbi:general stress protein [Virgibacillus sp. NKC19-16]|uniref:general stress protein n=1 Tax=Virgibacillus salidurans TaxID=2831673 RepID=UPI001F33B8EF|nr:general stress protein [Virgibacillus sp. NKC19-16]UJL47468.1 general stress protein [Virgibacillus sp. NKC19-16]